jgi:hypothetical protein
VFESSLELVVSRDRLACPNCRPRREPLDWLAPYARVTRRLAESVARLGTVTALVHAARWFGFNWNTVKQIDRQHRERTRGPVDLTGVTVIAIDPFAIQKGPVTQRRCWRPSASACCGSGADAHGLTMYVLKDDPKQLWRYRRQGWALRACEVLEAALRTVSVCFAQAELDRCFRAWRRSPMHTAATPGSNRPAG